MKTYPDWLPDLAVITGDIDDVHVRLYRLFLDAFRDDACRFEGLPVRWDSRLVPGKPYDQGYLHMVTRKDTKTGLRVFDSRRAERLSWCAAILENSREPEVLTWNYRHGGKRDRTYCWLENHDFVIAMEYRQRADTSWVGMYLVTAYYLDGERTRTTFRKQYLKGKQGRRF